ncbi:MAG: carboxypeptidase regulatory-like domain-containing protein, partial [Vicinamibacterales bacterium]
MTFIARLITIGLLITSITPSAAAAQAVGTLEGRVSDSSGARLPGVLVEVVSAARGTRAVTTTTTDAEGLYRFSSLAVGEYVVRFSLDGFSRAQLTVRVEPRVTVTLPAALEIERLTETVQVVASEIKLETTSSTQAVSISNEVLNELPTASRNYTHVIVAEAGVSAPLPDRTGKGLNIATNPGTQGDDSSQSLNPSVNGARPSNNGLRINGVDATNMLNVNGSLGNNIGIPLDALEEIELQTALPSASRGRNGGGNMDLITRSGADRFSGSAGYYFQHEKLNANEFFLNRGGVAKPEFRRNDTTVT